MSERELLLIFATRGYFNDDFMCCSHCSGPIEIDHDNARLIEDHSEKCPVVLARELLGGVEKELHLYWEERYGLGL